MGWLRSVYKVLGFEYGDEEPMSDWYRKRDARWRWVMSAGQWNGRVYVGQSCLLTQYDGQRDPDPRVIQDWSLQFVYDPHKWKVGQDHIYYDGPHCFYQFGPFALSWELDRDCKKCCSED